MRYGIVGCRDIFNSMKPNQIPPSPSPRLPSVADGRVRRKCARRRDVAG